MSWRTDHTIEPLTYFYQIYINRKGTNSAGFKIPITPILSFLTREALDRRTQSCSLYLSHALVSYKPSVLAFILLVKSQACSAVWKQVPISTASEETSWPLLRPRLLLPALEVAQYRHA